MRNIYAVFVTVITHREVIVINYGEGDHSFY